MSSFAFSSLPMIGSEFVRVSDTCGDRKHDATIADATNHSLHSYIAYLEKKLKAKNATIDDLKKKVEDQESTIRYCFTELETRNVSDAKTAGPRRDINVGSRPNAGSRNSEQSAPVFATRITHDPCSRIVTIALKNVSCVPRSSQ